MTINLCWDQQFSCLRLAGSGARNFLHGQTTANVLGKKDGEIFLTSWLTTTGKVRALIEARLDPDGASIIVLGGDKELLIKAFQMAIFPSDNVNLNLIKNLRRIQIIEAVSKDLIYKKVWLSLEEETPQPFNLFIKGDKVAIELWRLKEGLPIGNGEINGENNPFEIGLSHIIDFKKGCYLGQEAIARLSRDGSIRRKLIFWKSDYTIAEGDKIQLRDQKENISRKAGFITSSFNFLEKEGSLGLALFSLSSLNSDSYYVDSNQKIIHIEPINSELIKFI